jgi:hypothetical protein
MQFGPRSELAKESLNVAKTTAPSSAVYKGPDNLAGDMELALNVLASSLTITATECESHTHLETGGFGSPDTLTATAVYLVGSVAQCIQADLQIRVALFDDATRNVELLADIEEVVGDDSSDDQFKTMSRDPWIWEAISHLFVHLAKTTTGFHPSGAVLAKTQVKYDVNDHGLDLIAIYDAGELGITAGESKAYLNDPGRAITDAANRLREVDESLRDSDIRATVNQLRPALNAAHTAKLGGTFWRNERTYYPFVCCDEGDAVDWVRNRKVLRDLSIPVSRKMLVPFSIPNAKAVFDTLSSLMRAYAEGKLTS